MHDHEKRPLLIYDWESDSCSGRKDVTYWLEFSGCICPNDDENEMNNSHPNA